MNLLMIIGILMMITGSSRDKNYVSRIPRQSFKEYCIRALLTIPFYHLIRRIR